MRFPGSRKAGNTGAARTCAEETPALLPCRSAKPLDLQRLEYAGGDLWFALVNPLFEAPTAEMRAALPLQVPMASQIHNAAMGGTLVRRHPTL